MSKGRLYNKEVFKESLAYIGAKENSYQAEILKSVITGVSLRSPATRVLEQKTESKEFDDRPLHLIEGAKAFKKVLNNRIEKNEIGMGSHNESYKLALAYYLLHNPEINEKVKLIGSFLACSSYGLDDVPSDLVKDMENLIPASATAVATEDREQGGDTLVMNDAAVQAGLLALEVRSKLVSIVCPVIRVDAEDLDHSKNGDSLSDNPIAEAGGIESEKGEFYEFYGIDSLFLGSCLIL
jgi:hypothetical protein